VQSSILNYSQVGNTVGLLPTLAADAWFHKKVTVSPPPPDLPTFMTTVENFAQGPYAQVKAALPKIDRDVLQTLSGIVGISPELLVYWQLEPATNGAHAIPHEPASKRWHRIGYL
jgi:hypothetical protein